MNKRLTKGDSFDSMFNWLPKIMHKKNNENNCIGKHIIEDDIFPLQAMIYSINKFK